MLELKAEISGHSYSDLTDALDELRKKVDEEYRSGFDSNDTGRYSFEIEGSPIAYYRLKKGKRILKKQYSQLDQAVSAMARVGATAVHGFREDDYDLGLVT
jgi:hypothetical protein